jgi:murein DD-endopeptidase MepM/ murein hydrolase activator NlpD
MKRNRLLNSPAKSKLFSSEKKFYGKRHHYIALSIASVIGVFVTSMVLATSTPVSTDTKSQTINLPGQIGAEHTANSDDSSKQSVQLSLATPEQPTVNNPQTELVDIPDSSDLGVAESAQLERINLEESQQEEQSVSATTDERVNMAASTEGAVDPSIAEWKQVTVKSGDNLSLIFPKVGLSARDVYNVAQTGKSIKPLLNLKPGQELHFGLTKDEEGQTQLKQLDLIFSPIKKLELVATEDGYKAEILTKETDKRQKQVFGEIESSLFGSGLQAGLSDKLVMELAHIFGWDIDFALDLRQGDSFKVIFEEDYLDGKKFDDGDILAAEFTNRGKTFRAVRYTDSEGNTHYFTPQGESMRKTFTRTPVHFSRISSVFNPNRKHPVLKTNRPHRGVDYAAPTGTPILATGDGKVDFIGNKGGYGRVIILSHGGKYTTLYGHMSKFKSGLKRGQRVKQGQVIGYVGMSGLATGPHLHYEFRINGVHHNPLTVALPKAEPLNAKYMADFKQQSQPLLVQLDSLKVPTLALNQN